MLMKARKIALAAALIFAVAAFGNPARAASALSLHQVVEIAVEVNPMVRASRFRWESAQHQIIQNYTPADPQFAFGELDSWRGFLSGSGMHNVTVTQSAQFPGKGLLQGRNAARTAEIARLTQMATVRDVRAQAETDYYQIQLDLALIDLISQNVENLQRVQRVAEIAYTANQVSQGDFINSEFALEAERELLRQQQVTLANDRTTLNILLNRRPDEPLELERGFEMTTLAIGLDDIVARAIAARQEILEAALTEQNQQTAITLAQLEYAPDYTVGFGFDHWLIANFAPKPNHTEDYNFSIAFNLPLFFWAKNEDIRRARDDLEAAKEDLASIRNQTAGQVTTIYRQALRSRETALLYRDKLIPLAHQAFEVMLIAYQSGKADFTTLIAALRQQTDAQSTYLQAVNQMLASRIALEQAAGGSLQ